MTALDTVAPLAVSTVGLICLIVGAVMVVFFIGGLIAVSRALQARGGAATTRTCAAADQALEQARAERPRLGQGA